MYYFNKNFGLFIGKLSQNKPHKHFAYQLSISPETTMSLCLVDNVTISGKAIFLNSNIEHTLIADFTHLTVFINPLSAIGHQLHLNVGDKEFLLINDILSKDLSAVFKEFTKNEITFDNVCHQVSEVLLKYQCACESNNHFGDERIIKAIQYMEDNFEKVLSLELVSDYVHLSPTRFLHLFKEKTNLSFRRFQLWNKLIKSLPHLTNNSITETAHAFGFSDSSHYTRTFKETFGVTPKFLLPKQ